jgi:hypothetical protein
MIFRITYRPETGRAPELVEAEHVKAEGESHVVFRSTTLVIGQPREYVVRRVAGEDVLSVEADASVGLPT